LRANTEVRTHLGTPVRATLELYGLRPRGLL
jgi:hypothetical protein